MAGATSTPPKPQAPKAPEPVQVQLRYLGTSHELKDETTSLVFVAGGKPQQVSEEDAQRLLALPFDNFERVKE